MGSKISVKASPDVIHIPNDYKKIQWAVDNATDGDIILVSAGTYYEHVSINKSVSLIGEDRYSTIIDGNETGSVISVTANNVNINGFTMQNSGSTSSDSGIYVISSGNNISRNTITNNKNGIYLYHSSNNVVSGNNASNNNFGIWICELSSNNVVSGNNASNNWYGINLYYSSNNVVSGNNASNNWYGIYLYYSSNNVISDNNANSNNQYGIYLQYSSNNEVSDNNANSNNQYGIYLQYSSNNEVSDNNANSNNQYGIYLYYSSNNNTIYHNNFINNTDQVWSDSVNVWNDDNEGNHWSDYAGQDLNGDGIGDTPYVIDANNQDNYPLMGTLSDFKVTWKEETYHVTTICNSTLSDFRFEIGTETGNKIISFNVTGKDDTVGFCRVMIPTQLMNYSYIVLVDGEEIIPTLLNVSSKTHAYLYFTYVHSSRTITIISSRLLYLYNELLNKHNELLDKHAKLQIDFDGLNSTYHELLNNYGTLLDNYSQLLGSYNSLNTAYQELTGNYSQLLESYSTLNLTSHELLDNYGTLLGNYSQLLERYDTLNASYQEHLLDYSELQGNHTSLLLENAQNIRSLMYVFTATTTIFIIAAAYLSTHAHRKVYRS